MEYLFLILLFPLGYIPLMNIGQWAAGREFNPPESSMDTYQRICPVQEYTRRVIVDLLLEFIIDKPCLLPIFRASGIFQEPIYNTGPVTTYIDPSPYLGRMPYIITEIRIDISGDIYEGGLEFPLKQKIDCRDRDCFNVHQDTCFPQLLLKMHGRPPPGFIPLDDYKGKGKF